MPMTSFTTLSATVATALLLSSSVLSAPTYSRVGVDGQAVLNNGQSAWNNESRHYEDANTKYSSTSSSSTTVTHGDGPSYPVKIGIMPYADYRPFPLDSPASLYNPVLPLSPSSSSSFDGNDLFNNQGSLFDQDDFFKNEGKLLDDDKLFEDERDLFNDGKLYNEDDLFEDRPNLFNNDNFLTFTKRDAENKKEEYEDALIDVAKDSVNLAKKSVDVVRAGAGAVVDLAGKGISAVGDFIVGDEVD